jgi:hypothetical protein
MREINHAIRYFIGSDGNDAFIWLGFCPEIVKIMEVDSGERLIWCRMNGNDACIEITAADGSVDVESGKGIKLVQFNEGYIADDATSDPSAVDPTEYYKANGIQITGDLDTLEDDHLYLVEAWGMDMPIIKLTHDGGTTQTFVQDKSFDLKKCGVSSGWVVYNQSNGDMAYVKEIQKPAGTNKYSKATLATSRGGDATTAAAIADGDVLFLFPERYLQYPKSDIGMMS